MRFRSFVAAVAVTAAALTGGVMAAAPASAAPVKPVPQFAPYGNTFGTFGDHDYCRGTVSVSLTSPTRGVARVKLTSNGFTGNGAGWKRNPTCRVLFIAAHTSAIAYARETIIPASFGAKRGQTITRDIFTGSGPVNLGVAPYAVNTRVRLPQGYGFGGYLLVP